MTFNLKWTPGNKGNLGDLGFRPYGQACYHFFAFNCFELLGFIFKIDYTYTNPI